MSDRDKADIARVEAYLNGIETLTGKFLQIAPDGGLSEGRVWLRRPGRFRFEYEPPTPLLVVADGTFVVVYDRELSHVDRVPLGSTPLAILLRDKVKFAGEAAVEAVERRPGTLRLTLTATDQPEQGQLTLVFSDGPLQLKQWEVIDGRGERTAVSLSELEFNQPLVNRLFVFFDPVQPDGR